jgi:hypothetical protein
VVYILQIENYVCNGNNFPLKFKLAYQNKKFHDIGKNYCKLNMYEKYAWGRSKYKYVGKIALKEIG